MYLPQSDLMKPVRQVTVFVKKKKKENEEERTKHKIEPNLTQLSAQLFPGKLQSPLTFFNLISQTVTNEWSIYLQHIYIFANYKPPTSYLPFQLQAYICFQSKPLVYLKTSLAWTLYLVFSVVNFLFSRAFSLLPLECSFPSIFLREW